MRLDKLVEVDVGGEVTPEVRPGNLRVRITNVLRKYLKHKTLPRRRLKRRM
jgi:hypothetical protein